jgi:hypothetical protein
MIGSQLFIDLLKSKLNIGECVITFNNVNKLVNPHRYDDVWINFYNLPKEMVVGVMSSGALAENNRMSFSVSGFDKYDPNVNSATVGKVKFEMRINSYGREYNLRGKTATPEKIAEYLAAYINNIAATVTTKL